MMGSVFMKPSSPIHQPASRPPRTLPGARASRPLRKSNQPGKVAITAFALISLSLLQAQAAPPKKATSPPATNTKSQAAAPKHESKPVKGSKLFMWKMTSDAGATVYFLGTIHIARSDFYPLPDEIEKAFEKSSSLLVEADISDK